MIDLASAQLRVLECPSCQEPVAVPIDAADGATCACGSQVASPAPPVAPASAGLAVRGDEPPLLLDLRRPPADFAKLDQLLRATDLPALRAGWEQRKAILAEPHTPEDEFEALWLGASLARVYGGTGDPLRERAVLETALGLMTELPYRVLARARLARGAANARYFELAERFLAGPSDTRLPEVDADLDTARALLLLRREHYQEVVDFLGEKDDHGVDGVTRPLSDLVRIDALEKLDRMLAATALYRSAMRRHGAFQLQSLVIYYGFAKAARRRAVAIGIGTIVLVLMAVGVAAWWFFTHRGA